MNAGQSPQGQPPRSGSRLYYVIGFSLLIIMAGLWSLDDSFVYFSLGGAIFFFFLGFWKRPQPAPQSNYQSFKANRNKPPEADPFQGFKDLFKQVKQEAAKPRPPGTPQSARVVIVAAAFIGGIFFIITIAALFTDDSIDAMIRFQQGENARYIGQNDSALFYYRKALDQDPGHLDSWNGAGVVKLDQQEYDSAIYFFDQALGVDPDYDYARYNKALTFYYKKDYGKSLSETFSLLDRTPEYYDAMELAGNNYYDQQRYDSARYWYQQGYDNGVRNAWICHVLAYLYDQQGEKDKAVALYRETLRYDSSKVEVYERLSEMVSSEEANFLRAKANEYKQKQ